MNCLCMCLRLCIKMKGLCLLLITVQQNNKKVKKNTVHHVDFVTIRIHEPKSISVQFYIGFYF